MVLKINDANFESEVINSKEIVLLDFWAEWCGPCRMLSPILDEVASHFAGKVKIAKINVDESADIPSKYSIRSIPTMIIFKDGKNVSAKTGALSKEAIIDWVGTYLV